MKEIKQKIYTLLAISLLTSALYANNEEHPQEDGFTTTIALDAEIERLERKQKALDEKKKLEDELEKDDAVKER